MQVCTATAAKWKRQVKEMQAKRKGCQDLRSCQSSREEGAGTIYLRCEKNRSQHPLKSYYTALRSMLFFKYEGKQFLLAKTKAAPTPTQALQLCHGQCQPGR